MLLSFVLVGSLWVVRYLPTNDGPESVFAVHMENHYGDPHTIYREVFAPAPQFAGRGFTVLFEPLEAWLGWQRGLQAALSIIVLLEAWGFVALVRAADSRRLPLAFLGFPLALSWSFYMGFFAFVTASGVGLFVVALAQRWRSPRASHRALLATLLLLQAFLHMFAAALTGSVVAALWVARAGRGRRLVELSRAALTGLPAAALVTTAVLVARKDAVRVPFAEDFTFASLRETLTAWPRIVAPGPLTRAHAVNLVVCAAALIVGRRVVRRGTSPSDRAFAGVGITFLVVALLAPRDVPGWQLFSERFVWTGVLLALVALPLERVASRALRRCAAVTLFAAGLGCTLVAYPFHRRLAAASADAIAGLSASVQRHGVWLPVPLEPSGPPLERPERHEVPFLAPLRHIDGLYATVEGGITPYSFASNPATWPFVIRRDAIRPPPIPPLERYLPLFTTPEFQADLGLRQEQQDELATYGMFYEGVLLTGARADDVALWRERGYVADWERGSVLVGHFEPCALDVRLPRDVGPPLLDVGVGADTVLKDVERPLLVEADGAAHVVIAQGPCGRVWVRPHWDVGGSDGRPRASFCENAAATGELVALVTRTDGHLECTQGKLVR